MGRVLLVNDSRFESLIMSDLLGALGYNVLTADEYNVGDRLKTFRPDCVIVNYIMREMRGDQLISLIKVQYPWIRCILSSNNPIPAEEIRFKKIDAVIRTPVDKAALEKALQSAGETHSAQQNAGVQDSNAKEHSAPTRGDNRYFCPFCGKKLPDTSAVQYTFCPYCGGKLQQTGA